MTKLKEFEQSGEGLSYQEKNIIISLVSSIIVYAILSVLVWQRYQSGGINSAAIFQFWGRAVLLLIGVQIVLVIIGQIMLAIIHTIAAKKEDIPTIEDERDKLINLKATRNTFMAFGVGFMLSMIGLAVGMTPVFMPIILLVGMMAAEIVGNLSKLYYYRRGY